MTATVGIMLNRQLNHGDEELRLYPMVRREGEDFPTNPRSGWDGDTPLALGGVFMRGFVSKRSDGSADFLGLDDALLDTYYADTRAVVALGKTMKRIDAQIAKSRSAAWDAGLQWTPASNVAAFAKAIGAKWWAVPKVPNFRSYPDVEWEWRPIKRAVAWTAETVADMVNERKVAA